MRLQAMPPTWCNGNPMLSPTSAVPRLIDVASASPDASSRESRNGTDFCAPVVPLVDSTNTTSPSVSSGAVAGALAVVVDDDNADNDVDTDATRTAESILRGASVTSTPIRPTPDANAAAAARWAIGARPAGAMRHDARSCLSWAAVAALGACGSSGIATYLLIVARSSRAAAPPLGSSSAAPQARRPIGQGQSH